MALLVIAYPKLSKKDFDFIQAVRAKEDSLYYSVVDPHFTIVFPVNEVAPDAFINHVRNLSQGVSKFSFVIRCAVLDKDSFNAYTNVFLVPDEGYSRIVKTHDLFYTDILTRELRIDLPFIPHVGVASAIDPHHCKKVADALNVAEIEIKGTIEDLTIINFTNNIVTPLETIALKDHRAG